MSERKRPDLAERNKTHGLSRVHVSTYRSWKDMRARVNRPKNKDFKDYGGRGIQICDRWSDFANFFADMGERPAGKTIDRIDVNGNYEPSNCRWADSTTQANNKRTNRKIELDGSTKNLQEWCRELGLDPSKVRYRLSQGWTVEDALNAWRDFRK